MDPDSGDIDVDATLSLSSIISQNGSSDLVLDEIRQFAKDSPEYQSLIAAIWNETIVATKTGYVSLFKKFAEELSFEDGFILRNAQIVIPPNWIKEILKRIHSGHHTRALKRLKEELVRQYFGLDILPISLIQWKAANNVHISSHRNLQNI
jgi:hypothetical protein